MKDTPMQLKVARILSPACIVLLTCALLTACSTVARAEKPKIDCSQIRGVCYPITPRDQAIKELGYGKRVNLNAVRFWLSRPSFQKYGDQYIQQVVDFVRLCDEHGYKSMPILFNGNMLDPKTIEPEAYEQADAFATAIVNALKDEPGLLMFDVMNEPLCSPYISAAPQEERQARAEKIWTFLRREIELVQKLAPDALTTVGYTTAWEIEESTAKMIDVVSFHDYSDRREHMDNNFKLAKEWGEKLSKQVMNTETGCLARANPYELALQRCNQFGMGWFVFELMIHGRCVDEHGIFYPDGTIRDAATIAAMFGCYRNRDSRTVVPTNPNREGKVDQALNLLRSALKEYTSDAFDYRRSDKKALLDACEVAANLLEACELTPMSELPTTQIEAFRRDDNADLWEIRQFAYELAKRLQEVAQIF
ncbi:MAG: cellulase family glycosylhydrolase [Planctomycetia bacterium]|nr:cellulase family glycosylhydrolase [Planctomycetia bacterium]